MPRNGASPSCRQWSTSAVGFPAYIGVCPWEREGSKGEISFSFSFSFKVICYPRTKCWSGYARTASASPSWTSLCTPWLRWRWPLWSTPPSCCSASSRRHRLLSSTPSSLEWYGLGNREECTESRWTAVNYDGGFSTRHTKASEPNLKWLSKVTIIHAYLCTLNCHPIV